MLAVLCELDLFFIAVAVQDVVMDNDPQISIDCAELGVFLQIFNFEKLCEQI